MKTVIIRQGGSSWKGQFGLSTGLENKCGRIAPQSPSNLSILRYKGKSLGEPLVTKVPKTTDLPIFWILRVAEPMRVSEGLSRVTCQRK
jgi:hypothetical protein